MMHQDDRRSEKPLYRRLAPLALFSIAMLVLFISAAMSIGDLVSLRNLVAGENDLLVKLNERAAKSDGKAAFDPQDYVFDAASQGVATAELQRRVSELLSSSGADLQLSEIIPADATGDVGRLAIAINFEIDEMRLPDLLHAIENSRPALLIERLSARTISAGTTTGRQRLQGTATIVAAVRGAS